MSALDRALAALARRAARRRADRALLRLARSEGAACHPHCPTCRTLAEIAREPAMPTEDEMRSPDWCWTHGCHRSQCPQPEPQGGDNQ